MEPLLWETSVQLRGHLSIQNMIDHNDYSFLKLLGTTAQQFVREKLTLIFYKAACEKW